MSDHHMLGHRVLEAGGRTLAVALGLVMMVSGLGMGVTMVLIPIGIPLGLIGLLLALWGVFYSDTNPNPPGASSPHGGGTDTAHH